VFVLSNPLKVIILLTVVALLFSPPVHINNLWWHEVINSGHTVLFFFLSFIIYSRLKAIAPDSSVLIIYLYVIAIGILLGIVIEGLQTLVHREFGLNDIYGNLYGIMAGLCLHAFYKLKTIHHKNLLAAVMFVGSTGFLLAGLSPLMLLSWHYVERANAFPVVMDFDSSWARSFIRYNKKNYPGVSIIEPEPDWSGYRQLRLSLHSNNKHDVNLVLRVHDNMHNQKHSDRFNMKLLVQPGLNEFQISLNAMKYGPLERELNLNKIAGVILFSSKLEEWKKIEISNLSLE